MAIHYYPMSPEHFEAIIALGNQVHGDNYLDHSSLSELYDKGQACANNASFVAINLSAETNGIETPRWKSSGYLVGFRITSAPGQWAIDKWCTPEKWGLPSHRVCYFKSNTVDHRFRGRGIGSELLQRSIAAVKCQGGVAGLAHIWLASPKNSAFRYFSANGGKLIKKHPDKWLSLSIDEGYTCGICGTRCRCEAGEMLLTFKD